MFAFNLLSLQTERTDVRVQVMQANNIGLYLLSLLRERIEVRVLVIQESTFEPLDFIGTFPSM